MPEKPQALTAFAGLNHHHQLWAKECDAGDAPIGAPAHTPADSGLWCPPLPEVEDSKDLPPPGRCKAAANALGRSGGRSRAIYHLANGTPHGVAIYNNYPYLT